MKIDKPASPAASDDWREFLWGALAAAFGETFMHPVDTLKTRIQSVAQPGSPAQPRSLAGAFRLVVRQDGVPGLYRGVGPALTGSLVTGATYFGIIEATKYRLTDRPDLITPWSSFLAGATGEAVGSVVYVPCEVVKQRMQLQGRHAGWAARAASGVYPPSQYHFYTGMLQAGRSILAQEGVRGLYAGYFSTLARDLPFAGLQIMFYEFLKEGLHWAHHKWGMGRHAHGATASHEFSSTEELVMGGLAGGVSAVVTTPLDVIKTRLQTQGAHGRYQGWLDAFRRIALEEGHRGLFKGCIPRLVWFMPASALTFLALDILRKAFNTEPEQGARSQLRSSEPSASASPDVRNTAADLKRLLRP